VRQVSNLPHVIFCFGWFCDTIGTRITRIRRICTDFFYFNSFSQTQAKSKKICANPPNPCHPRSNCITKLPEAKYIIKFIYKSLNNSTIQIECFHIGYLNLGIITNPNIAFARFHQYFIIHFGRIKLRSAHKIRSFFAVKQYF
jgi:hypothetical protein